MRIVLHGSTGDVAVPLGTHVLGRGQDCTLRIDDPRLSRHHAELHHYGDHITITDKGSMNGVLINGERVRGPQRLENGQTIICGPCVFTVTMDPTQKAAKSDATPHTDRRSDLQDTEAMQPLAEGASPDAIPASSKNRGISPLIAAALPGQVTPHSSEASSLVLVPSNEDEKTRTGALATKLPTKPASAPKTSPVDKFHNKKSPAKKRSDNTSVLFPSEFVPGSSSALQPDFPLADRLTPAKPIKKVLGSLLDGVTCTVFMLWLSLPCFIGGYAWALQQAGVVIDGTLPRLSSAPNQALSLFTLAGTLWQDGGVERALQLIQTLARLDNQQPFLTFFMTATLGSLLMAVVFLLYLVGGTVLHGAPFWQRKLKLTIVEQHTGYRLTWIRAIVRWFLWCWLWPLSVISLLINKRGLADVLSGCTVRQQW
jgi:FHA domain